MPAKKVMVGPCKVDGCDRGAVTKHMCQKHYFAEYTRNKKVKEGHDRHGRLKYDPEYHPNDGKPYTLKELSYISKYYAPGEIKYLALAVGRTEGAIRQQVAKMRKAKQFELYKSLEMEHDEEFYECG